MNVPAKLMADATQPSSPSLLRAWVAVVLLSLMYLVSNLDRMVLALLVEPIRAEFGVSDTQVGLLIGTSFAIFYTAFGVLLSRVADYGNRRNLIVAGCLVWTSMTAASAFATDFTMLLVLRIGVALGEAALTPAAMSLMADLFPRDKRSLPTSVYVATGASGISSALIIAAAVLQFSASPAMAAVPVIGGLDPWRITLFLVGAPGILLALAFLAVVREPARGAVAGPRPPLTAALTHVREHLVTYVGFFGMASLMSLLNIGVIAWYPTHLVRTYGLSASEAGYMFGIFGIIATAIGGLLVPHLADRQVRRGRNDGAVTVSRWVLLLIAPLLIAGLLAGSATMSLLFTVPAYLLQLGLGIMVTATIPMLASGRVRGQMIAIYFVVANMVGLGLGPVLVAFLSDSLFPGASGIAYSLATLVALLVPAQLLLLGWSRRAFATTFAASAAEDAEAAQR